jgi:hypothetical protein
MTCILKKLRVAMVKHTSRHQSLLKRPSALAQSSIFENLFPVRELRLDPSAPTGDYGVLSFVEHESIDQLRRKMDAI